MREALKVMKALSDGNRLKIIKMLQKRVLCVCEIREGLGIAQSTASKHLKVLEEAGLVTCEKDGLWVDYRIAEPAGNPYAGDMLRNLDSWLGDDPEMKELLGRLSEIRREVICGM